MFASRRPPVPARFRTRALTLLLAAGLAACSATGPEKGKPLVFYPDPPDPPRIQFLRSVSMGDDIETGQSGLDTLLFGEKKVDKGIMAPYGCAVHDGKVFVCDVQQGVVLILDFTGRRLDFVHLTGRAVLQKPTNLDFGPDGRLYVADTGRKQIVVLGPDLGYVTEYGPFSERSRPVDVQVAGDRLYVADAGDPAVRVIDLGTGEVVRSFGAEGTREERLRAPTNLVVDAEGSCYVVDSINNRIHMYGPDGSFVRHIGEPGDVVGQFARPKGIALYEGRLFVVDAAFENCQILDLEGEPLMFFGGSGVDAGDMYLPAGVWMGREGLDLFKADLDPDFQAEALIIVTNLFGPYKVNFYAFGRHRKFQYPDTGAGG